tara:strand:- start:6700 stop:6864 length:165 start_codon:yes stop_codon:yes gene_type:complete
MDVAMLVSPFMQNFDHCVFLLKIAKYRWSTSNDTWAVREPEIFDGKDAHKYHLF